MEQGYAMNRREFIKAGATALGLNVSSVLSAEPENDSCLKFCLFADIHYYPGVYPHDTVEWLDRVLDRARREKAAFVMHLGDFAHEPKKCIDYVNHYNDCGMPAYHVLGNHDCDGNTYEETWSADRLERGHYHFDFGGWRFVVLDTNYCCLDGRFFHYSLANYPGHHLYWKTHDRKELEGHSLSDTRVPPEQLDWFAGVVERSPYPCVVASHASFERANGSPDSAAIRKIINETNKRHPGRVRLVLNGHHHRDHVRILENVIYMDVNSANYDWFLKEHDKYPAAYAGKWSNVRHCIFWDDPISAIISLWPTGRINVDGQRSRFHLGVAPANAGYNPFDRAGRPTSTDIQSFDVSLAERLF